MKTTLTFDVTIDAPRAHVWDVMLAPNTYSQWTAPFSERSYYEGSWEQGDTIRFLTGDGNGAFGVVKGHQVHELISIEHHGIIRDGKEDRESAEVKAWAPAYEDYRLMDEGEGTALQVNVDVMPDCEDFMADAFPKALLILKQLCEGSRQE